MITPPQIAYFSTDPGSLKVTSETKLEINMTPTGGSTLYTNVCSVLRQPTYSLYFICFLCNYKFIKNTLGNCQQVASFYILFLDVLVIIAISYKILKKTAFARIAL